MVQRAERNILIRDHRDAVAINALFNDFLGLAVTVNKFGIKRSLQKEETVEKQLPRTPGEFVRTDGPQLYCVDVFTARTLDSAILFNRTNATVGMMSWPLWLQPYIEVLLLWISWAIDYVDWDYVEYLAWLFLPLFIAFVLPVVLLFFIYGCIIFLHIYGLRNRIREAYASSMWDGARISIASFWDAVGYVWHGYEIRGLNNVPTEGPALFVYYHGTLPIDVYYVIAKCMLHKKRTLHCVGDKFIFKMPGWGMICKVFCITPGTVEDCIIRIKDGHLLCIAPGGVREALFSDPTRYNIMWARRMGFAKVIIGCPGIPVIPMFTENCRDAFRTPRCGRELFRWIYEKTRLPLCPIYGGFPVKMMSVFIESLDKTHLGKPIHFAPDIAPDDVKKSVKEGVQNLIQAHQRLPGSILRGILQRFYDKRKSKQDLLLRENSNQILDSIALNEQHVATEETRPSAEITLSCNSVKA